ncbi:methyltransferase domain-containing protein [Limnoglobus roseus]|uniref:Methyltransferase domain-containing protein n=1 Tax=Limnoglobus roseus TaxID=2598579 RepID=A0A5C1ADH7_9BACT|nr:methyltransferase domain-containing protein [Limnoglobus roseus]QEL16217.1 methyltransferase domain-containing protein [Limnoglobus roseus]
MPTDVATETRTAIRTAFDRIAASTLTGADVAVREFALACGYSVAELASVPVAANLGLMCGHPLRFADLRPGEVVLDVGCGGGLDALLAASAGCRVIGCDLSPGMVERAEINLRQHRVRRPDLSAEFRVADLEALPFESASVDRVLSNNAFHYANLGRAFAEAYRVLKPGGRLAFCDLAWKDSPPEGWVGADDPAVNLAGVASVTEIGTLLRRQRFELGLAATERAVLPRGTRSDGHKGPTDADRLNRWVESSQGCCGVEPPPSLSRYHDTLAKVADRDDLRDRLATVLICATKPRA